MRGSCMCKTSSERWESSVPWECHSCLADIACKIGEIVTPDITTVVGLHG